MNQPGVVQRLRGRERAEVRVGVARFRVRYMLRTENIEFFIFSAKLLNGLVEFPTHLVHDGFNTIAPREELVDKGSGSDAPPVRVFQGLEPSVVDLCNDFKRPLLGSHRARTLAREFFG